MEPVGPWPETEHWEFDVTTALHDDLKDGLAACRSVRSRVVLSREYSYATAKDQAGAVAVAVHGGIPVDVRWRC